MINRTSSARILVVDDSEDSADITSIYLETGGFNQIEVVNSGQAALEIVGARDDDAAPTDDAHFDIIIMDIGLPDIDGIEVCARMRLNRPTRHTPILILSAAKEVQALNQAFMAGASDFVGKPISSIDLLARVRTLLRLRREQARRQLREEELTKTTRSEERRRFDASLMDDVTMIPNARFLELAVRQCGENGLSASLALVHIANFYGYVERYGEKAAKELVLSVRDILGNSAAPLRSSLIYYGNGTFMIFQPAAPDAAALTEVCAQITASTANIEMVNANGPAGKKLSLITHVDWRDSNDLDDITPDLLAKLDALSAKENHL
ncbi:response regulator [Altericroceibacterium endophyticum]|nr:response regulator [Altericroceibacterium endophyticum]